ncbi:MAG: GAF domain-containing protein [Gemmatimonadota bacterium]
MGHLRGPAFPFSTYLSLEGVLEFWRGLGQDPGHALSAHARTLLHRAEGTGQLRGRIADAVVIERHRSLVEALLSALFPTADAQALGAVGAPFAYTNIYETPAARRTGVFSEDAFRDGLSLRGDVLERGEIIAAYQYVLLRCYGIDAKLDYPMLMSRTDTTTGLLRHYQVGWDSAFVEVAPRGPKLHPSDADLRRLLAEPTNLALWMEVLPPERFELGGLSIVRATDVTVREAVSRLKDDLLQHDAMASPAHVERWQQRIRTLLGAPDVEVGVIGFGDASDVSELDYAFPVGRSLLLCSGALPECPERGESNYAEAFTSGAAVIVSDLEHARRITGLEASLMAQGFKSLLLQPLFVGQRLLGLLEVASPREGAMSALSAFKLSEVAQPFATALERRLGEREVLLQSIIKRKYTAIHPSVEWRFREAAARVLDGDEEEMPEPIVFPGVYPVYGLTDIRGSSETRSRAIQGDLVEQLELGLAAVQAAGRRPSLPVLDQLAFRMEQCLERVRSELRSEDETAALTFLGQEIEPLLDDLAALDPDVARAVEAYREALDPRLGVVYRRRQAFEHSVARFNETVAQVLEREQELAQAVFPHFFEKFQSDGVDYNVYVGDSIARHGGFSELHLHNLRLWQLEMIARIEWELARVRPTLSVDLAPTHLVLVQDQPLAIRFRVDEKRFDVDGAYNIRYELVKKRIDKAHIRSTGERLTQPGYLAVVYSHAHEGVEYRRYFEYLIASGYYTGPVEEHELEDMQGVRGLRALRLGIASVAPDTRPDGARGVAAAGSARVRA